MNPHAAQPTSPAALGRSLWRNRQLILQMTRREVLGRYKGSFMGLAWSLFTPLLMLAVYTFLFSVVFKARWGDATMPIANCLDALSAAKVVRVIAAPAENLWEVSTGSIDIVFSNAVLEHTESPAGMARELHRITRSGGYGIHQVDFRDHRDFSRPLEYLLLGADDFERMFAERHGECGRQIRHYEMRELFEEAGFKVAGFDANWIAKDGYLDDFLPRLQASQSAYCDVPRSELRTISGRFFLQKPANN
jgi:SAM-dependent methyltransferase